MTGPVARVDAWARRGDFTAPDLALFRIVFATAVLLTLTDVGAVSDSPATEFAPPPGPMRLLTGVPPDAVLESIELGTALLAALLLVGLWTRTVSFLLALALMTGFGLTYSFGKVDHTIVLVLVPAIMGFSAWGSALSVDAGGRAPDSRGQPATAQWPVRMLAFTIGLAFVTAGVAKVRSGWLDVHNHATEGHFIRGFFNNGRDDWLGPLFLHLHVGPAWELVDWLTVALELGLLVSVLYWRTLRIGVAVAALFHLGVLLMMNIVFHANVIGYGAFVLWSTVVPRRWWPPMPASPRRGAALAAAVGAAAYLVHGWVDRFSSIAGIAAIFVGACIGGTYLAIQATQGWSRWRGRGA